MKKETDIDTDQRRYYPNLADQKKIDTFADWLQKKGFTCLLVVDQGNRYMARGRMSPASIIDVFTSLLHDTAKSADEIAAAMEEVAQAKIN